LDSNTIDLYFTQVDTLKYPYSASLGWAGYLLSDADTVRIYNDSAFVRSFREWQIIKIRSINMTFEIYFNDTLISIIPYERRINKIYNMHAQFKGGEGYLDYFKVYDSQGRLQYVEEFEDCNQSLSNYPEAFSCDSITGQAIPADSLLCGSLSSVAIPISPFSFVSSCSDSSFFVYSKSSEVYKIYSDSIKGSFENDYRLKCLQAYKLETFTVTHQQSEFHYTLYYYDQAGNLVKTVMTFMGT
jgi:hypothetical protein